MTILSARPRISVIVAVLGLAGATAAACGLPLAQAETESTPQSAAAPLRCEIALSAATGTTVIEGHVHARSPASGRYELTITTRSRAGSSTIRQAGEFTLPEAGAAIMGETRLSGPAARIEAEMTVHSRGRSITCAQTQL